MIVYISLKLKLRPAKTLETLNLAREHQQPADPCSRRKCFYFKANSDIQLHTTVLSKNQKNKKILFKL